MSTGDPRISEAIATIEEIVQAIERLSQEARAAVATKYDPAASPQEREAAAEVVANYEARLLKLTDKAHTHAKQVTKEFLASPTDSPQ